jgi:phospholipid-binding lipoprotein MlaA
MRALAFLVAAGLLLGGCATSLADPAGGNDPYEATNRVIFDFNLKVDRLALRPTAEGYQDYVPEEVRNSLKSALDNLHAPVVFANDLLQGETRRASQMAGRFLVNSTLGLGGLFDVAGRMGLASHDEDFGQTLGVWGAREGPYVVLPLLGPSNPRDAVGKAADIALDPSIYIKIKRHLMWEGLRQYLNIVDTRARSLETLDAIERDSLDFYASARSLYRQNRAYQIRNGLPSSDEEFAATNLP